MKTKIFLTILFLTLAYAATVLAQSNTQDEGVIINGVRWATRNVDMPGTFAETPESAGKFYQWNRNVAWSATGKIRGWNTSTMPEGAKWEKVNDPSPAGWRVPTSEEINSLLDTEKVSSEWITQNGIDGRIFTDKENGNSIFLPALGLRYFEDGLFLGMGSAGFYWSATRYHITAISVYCLWIDINVTVDTDGSYNYGNSIRPVAE